MKICEPKNLRSYCQQQSLLFPANLLDFIKDDDLCMVVDDVVNNLDLSCLYVNIASEGNMAYHPMMMLKVLFYAYTRGIFSSRKIAKALGENIGIINGLTLNIHIGDGLFQPRLGIGQVLFSNCAGF